MLKRYAVFSASVASLYHDIQQIERTEMARFGLKGPHAQCLLVLQQHPQGMTAVQLRQACDKDKAAISRTVSELEEAGMVCRQQQGGGTYRALVTLTPAGEAAAQAVACRAQLAVERAGEGLEEEKRRIFYEVLALIAGNLHTVCRDGLEY